MKYTAPILIGLAIIISNLIVYKFSELAGYKRGLTEGIDMYHQLCYNSPDSRIAIHDDGTVVMCAPLTKIIQGLDKQPKT